MRQASVLIVDSDGERRVLCLQRITQSGHTVLAEAQTASQALTLARALRPDIILLDLRAPTTAGWDLAKTISSERIAALLLIGEVEGAATLWEIEASSIMGFLRDTPQADDFRVMLPLASARYRERIALEEEVRELNERMESRKLVGRAKAILMERQNLTERDAFRRIQSQSLTLGKPVQDIARAIITASEISTAVNFKDAANDASSEED